MSDELDDFDEEESDKLGSESGSSGTFVTRVGGFLRDVGGGLLPGIGLPLVVMLYSDEL